MRGSFLQNVQAIILNLFNATNGSLPIHELQRLSGINISSLKRVLNSLSVQQNSLLKEVTYSCKNESASSLARSSIGDNKTESYYFVNCSFQSRFHRFRLPLPDFSFDDDSKIVRGHSTQTILSKAREEALVARKDVAEAAIVRLLKGRKALSENDIFLELQNREMHTFRPDLSLVKLCLKALVEKEYVVTVDAEYVLYTYCP